MLVPLEHRLDRPQNEIEQLTSSISRSVLVSSQRLLPLARDCVGLFQKQRRSFGLVVLLYLLCYVPSGLVRSNFLDCQSCNTFVFSNKTELPQDVYKSMGR